MQCEQEAEKILDADETKLLHLLKFIDTGSAKQADVTVDVKYLDEHSYYPDAARTFIKSIETDGEELGLPGVLGSQPEDASGDPQDLLIPIKKTVNALRVIQRNALDMLDISTPIGLKDQNSRGTKL